MLLLLPSICMFGGTEFDDRSRAGVLVGLWLVLASDGMGCVCLSHDTEMDGVGVGILLSARRVERDREVVSDAMGFLRVSDEERLGREAGGPGGMGLSEEDDDGIGIVLDDGTGFVILVSLLVLTLSVSECCRPQSGSSDSSIISGARFRILREFLTSVDRNCIQQISSDPSSGTNCLSLIVSFASC